MVKHASIACVLSISLGCGDADVTQASSDGGNITPDGPCVVFGVVLNDGNYCTSPDGMGGECHSGECVEASCVGSTAPMSGALCDSVADCCPPGPCFRQTCGNGSRRCQTTLLDNGTPCDGGECLDGQCVAN